MNNEANKDAEAFERHFFNWLLEKSTPSASPQTEAAVNHQTDTEGDSSVESFEWDEPDPPGWGDLAAEVDCPSSTDQPPHLDRWGYHLGEIPTVQDRFQTLLKERLRAEIQRNPPLFPWETEMRDYEPDYPDGFLEERVPLLELWATEVKNLRWGLLPIPITETIFAQLLTPCQEVVLSALREGAKLVRAVDSLFPGNSESLNELAGLVMRGAALRGALDLNQITDYEEATPEQQMVLSLLAAREIIGSLTLICPQNQPPVERQWLTALGLLTLTAEYRLAPERSNSGCVRVECYLPAGGSLQMRVGEAETTAHRPNSGYLSVELFDPQPNKTYPLQVWFQNQEQKPLKFGICPVQTS
ncbi:MAG: hypothetical protein ACM37W_16475 [Actinomycetota bacterium]